ncbi:MAG: hypothetical protein ACJ8GK_08870, partial [Luteimonas sp.]
EGLLAQLSEPGACPASRSRVTGDPHATASAPPRIAHLVFSRLLGHVIHHAGVEPVHIEVERGWVRLRPWGACDVDVRDGEQRRSDERFGLTLLSRLCQRLGWQLEATPAAGVLVLRFPDSTAARLSA